VRGGFLVHAETGEVNWVLSVNCDAFVLPREVRNLRASCVEIAKTGAEINRTFNLTSTPQHQLQMEHKWNISIQTFRHTKLWWSMFIQIHPKTHVICGGQSGSGKGFALILQFYSVTTVSFFSPVRRKLRN
jgi:hypothetical protein